MARGYVTRVVFLSCLGTLQKRESWQTKRFSIGIVLTILPSPNSRRWLMRPYRRRPNKRPWLLVGRLRKLLPRKMRLRRCEDYFCFCFGRCFEKVLRRTNDEERRNIPGNQPFVRPSGHTTEGHLPLTDPSTCESTASSGRATSSSTRFWITTKWVVKRSRESTRTLSPTWTRADLRSTSKEFWKARTRSSFRCFAGTT